MIFSECKERVKMGDECLQRVRSRTNRYGC